MYLYCLGVRGQQKRSSAKTKGIKFTAADDISNHDHDQQLSEANGENQF